MKPARKTYLDVARVVATIAVVIIHLSAAAGTTGGRMHWFVVTSFSVVSRFSVPLFIMISGALLLSGTRVETPVQFYRRRLVRILPPLIFWSIFYLCWRRFYQHEALSLKDGLRNFVFATPYAHLYFLFLIAGLYMITPLLQIYTRHEEMRGQRTMAFIALGWTATVAILGVAFHQHNDPLSLTLFTSCVGYYLMGHVAASDGLGEQWYQFGPLLFIGGAVIAMAGVGGLHHLGKFENARGLFSGYTGPVVMLMTIGAFTTFAGPLRPWGSWNRELPRLIRELSVASFGIYLIHPLIIELLRRCHVSFVRPNTAIAIPLWTIVVLVISCVLTRLAQKVPYLRAVFG